MTGRGAARGGKRMAAVPADSHTQATSFGPWIWYLLAFFFPFAGLLTALFLYDQESWDVRKIGRNSLLISLLVWIVLPFLLFLFLLLIGTLAIGGIISSVLTPMD